ncbi:MAG TPA: hypothetical protein VJ001_11915 [Rhodocyclaceae bacterium]|nr:hypothetical protein [Rhodocyclaceae bacterium]
MKFRKFRLSLTLIPLLSSLAGCEQLGLETPAQSAVRMEAEGRAIGSSCRQAGRALEDCYQINPTAPKAAIFAGWREMDAYMRENKLEEVTPLFPMKPPEPKKKKTPKPVVEPKPAPTEGSGEGAPPATPAATDAASGHDAAGEKTAH